MAYFPDVIPGQRISHSALLENNIRHIVNAFNGYGSNSVSYGVQRQNNTVSVYNTTQTVILANTAVSFVSCAENILGVVPYNGSDVFGITVSNIDVNSVGSAVISGCVFVACSGSGTKASPQIQNPSVFILGDTGFPVLYSSGNSACVNIGVSGESGGGTVLPYYDFEFGLYSRYDQNTGYYLIGVNGGYAIGINGEKWVSDLYISNQNTGYYFQFEPNEHYVVYFKPDHGYTQYKDAGNNVTEFYAFPNTDYQLAISKANILGTSYIPLQVKSTLYKCVIGTFDTDSTGQMILSSWNQIHGGSFFLPYVVPNGGSSTPAPYGETEEPETPEEPTQQSFFDVVSVEYFSGGDPQQKQSYENIVKDVKGRYLYYGDGQHGAIYKNVNANIYAFTPQMSNGRCGFQTNTSIILQSEQLLKPVNLQGHIMSGHNNYECLNQTMVPNDVVFDLLVTWHNEPVSLMIFEEETSENE